MNSRKMIVLFMIMLLTFGAYDVVAGGCGSSCAGCGGCEEQETEFKVFGSSRYRLNTDGFDFNSDTPLNWFSEMQTRVGIKAKANDKVGAFFQLQDCRTIAVTPGYDFTNRDIQMHQGYLWYKPCDMGWLKAGRFEVDMHNGRLIGAVPWDNTGRTFEGMMFGRKFDKVGVTAMALQLGERFDNFLDTDNDVNKPAGDPMLYGANINLPEQQVDLFLYYLMIPTIFGAGTDDLTLMTFGAYSERKFGSDMWYESMFAMQSGTHDDGVDLSGMLAYAKIGKMFDKFGLAAGVDYTTGDDPTTNDKYEGFNNLFMDYHRYYGYMDMFYNPVTMMSGRDEGLMDLFFAAKYLVNDMWKIGGTYHMFSTVEDIFGTTETKLGGEFDLFVKYHVEDFTWKTGYSMFSPNEDVYGANADSQGWWFSQGTVHW